MEEQDTKNTALPSNVSIDLSKVSPLYVSAMSISYSAPQKIFLIALFSGMRLPAENNQHVMYHQLVGAYAFDENQARYLFDNLKAYLQQLEDQNRKQP